MQTVWKYKLQETGIQSIEIPIDAIFLKLELQNNIPCIWLFIPETEAKKSDIVIKTYYTGEPISKKDSAYVGTYAKNGLVSHVFFE